MLKNIISVVVAIPTLFSVFKVVNEYFKKNPKSNIKLYFRSLIISLLCSLFVIVLMMFLYSKIYYGDYKSQEFKGIYSLIEVSALLILLFVFSLFFVKDYMKTNYSFLMAADFKKSIKQNNMFSKYSNDILKDISSCIVDNDFKVSGRLEKLKKSQNSIYKKRNVTKVYELISFISWFALPLLMSQVYVGIFTAYKGIELFIMLLITLIAFVLANSLAVYFDLKLQRGDVSATDKMIGYVAKLKLYAHLYKTIKANIVLTVKSFVSINYFSFFSINIT